MASNLHPAREPRNDWHHYPIVLTGLLVVVILMLVFKVTGPGEDQNKVQGSTAEIRRFP